MAQRWSTTALVCALVSPLITFQKQNQIAHFLWPQIPLEATPYPSGVVFSSYNTRPEHNHSFWGMLMFPVAASGFYFAFKYSLGTLLKLVLRSRYRLTTAALKTPQYLSFKRTLQVKAPAIVQKGAALSLAVPFAMGAKVWRDGPGDRWDAEFYRSGYIDSSWDVFQYLEQPAVDKHLVEHPINLISSLQRIQDHSAQLDFPLDHEHPHTETLDSDTARTWFNTSLGYQMGSVRKMRDNWSKLRVFAEKRAEWFEDTDPMTFETQDQGKLKSKFIYDPDKFAFDHQTPVGQLPHFGASEADGLRFPYASDDEGGQSEFISKGGGVVSQEDFFNLNPKARKKWETEDEDLTIKFRDLITNNAITDKGSTGFDPYSLEQRRDIAAAQLFKDRGHESVHPRDFNPYQSFYFHADSVVGRDIPFHARIAANATDTPFSTEDDELVRLKHWEPKHYLDQEGQLPWSSFNHLHENVTEADRRARLQTLFHIPLTLDNITEDKVSINSIAQQVTSIHAKKAKTAAPPGYGLPMPPWYLLRMKSFESDRSYDGFMFRRNDWIPNVQRNINEHRHDYYTGRGRRYADEPNYVTGAPAYDPNSTPSPPLPHGTRNILDVENYYTAAEKVDQEYAKRVAGSFKKLYGNPFPKFEDPILYDSATVDRYPHLAQVNKRLEMQTRYFNSLEDRVLTKAPLTHSAREQSTLSKTVRNEIPHNWEEAKQKFNSTLYRTSSEYRRVWSEKFPALKAYGDFPTAEQIEYVLNFSPKNYQPKQLKARALPKSHLTDRAVREAVELDMSYLTDPERTFGAYKRDTLPSDRRELYPRDLLVTDELHHGYQPGTQFKGQMVHVGRRDMEAESDIQ